MDKHFDVLDRQEELLRFEKFDQNTAYELGCFMTERAKKLGKAFSVAIYLNDGSLVFQCLPEGTTGWNENWMRRKANVVRLMQRSSMYTKFLLEGKNETLQDGGLSMEDYALTGGGFPIRLKGMNTVLGAVIASGYHYIEDHEFVTGSLKEFLSCDEAPAYPYTQEDLV